MLRVPAHRGWVKINAGHSGFYRVAYAPELLGRLTQAVAAGRLSTLDVFGLLDDAFALAQAGHLRTSQAMDLLANCRRYTDYTVWLTVAGSLAAVERLLREPHLQHRLDGFSRDLFHPLAERLGWERRSTDGHLDALLRALIIGRLGHYQDAATIQEARQRFSRFVRTGGLLPDIRGAVYATVAEHGEAPEYAKLLKVYRMAGMQEERVRVLRALTCFQQPNLIRTVLRFALSDQVRAQDAYAVVGGFGHNRAGRHLAWQFIQTHWKTLVQRYASGGLNLMARIVEGATNSFATEADFTDVRRFFTTHPVAGTERAMRRSLETIQTTIRWARRDGTDLRSWLTVRPLP